MQVFDKSNRSKSLKMKIVFLMMFIVTTLGSFAQNVTIAPTGISPNQGGSMAKLSYEEIQRQKKF